MYSTLWSHNTIISLRWHMRYGGFQLIKSWHMALISNFKWIFVEYAWHLWYVGATILKLDLAPITLELKLRAQTSLVNFGSKCWTHQMLEQENSAGISQVIPWMHFAIRFYELRWCCSISPLIFPRVCCEGIASLATTFLHPVQFAGSRWSDHIGIWVGGIGAMESSVEAMP